MTIAWADLLGGPSNVESISSNRQILLPESMTHSFTATTGSLEVYMPPVKFGGDEVVRPGEFWCIWNNGTNAFTVKTFSGAGAIGSGLTIDQDEMAIVWLHSAATTAGTWNFILKDTTSASAGDPPSFGTVYGLGSSSTTVERYQHILDSWSTFTEPMPVAFADANGGDTSCEAEEADVYLHLLTASTEDFYAHDPSLDNYTSKNDPGNGESFATLTYEPSSGNVYGLGGTDTDQVEEWDSALNSWTTLANLSNVLPDAGLNSWSDREDSSTVITSFQDGLLTTPKVLLYDTSDNSEALGTPPPRLADTGFGGAKVRDADEFLEYCGRTFAGAVTQEVWKYASNVWTSLSPTPFAGIHTLYSWGVGGLVYAYGGIDGSSVDQTALYALDPDLDSWNTMLASNNPAGDQEGKPNHAHPVS